MATFELTTQIDIEAPVCKVWTTLCDFPSYSSWNPFITHITGEPVLNSRLRVQIAAANNKKMSFTPKILSVKPQEELIWLGHLVVPGLFDGRHSFLLQKLDDTKTRFVHSEKFSGVFVGFLRSQVEKDTYAGFQAMNRALKLRAEQSSA